MCKSVIVQSFLLFHRKIWVCQYNPPPTNRTGVCAVCGSLGVKWRRFHYRPVNRSNRMHSTPKHNVFVLISSLFMGFFVPAFSGFCCCSPHTFSAPASQEWGETIWNKSRRFWEPDVWKQTQNAVLEQRDTGGKQQQVYSQTLMLHHTKPLLISSAVCVSTMCVWSPFSPVISWESQAGGRI